VSDHSTSYISKLINIDLLLTLNNLCFLMEAIFSLKLGSIISILDIKSFVIGSIFLGQLIFRFNMFY
jgi:hypothetical protein